jgi:hypothetical protein
MPPNPYALVIMKHKVKIIIVLMNTSMRGYVLGVEGSYTNFKSSMVLYYLGYVHYPSLSVLDIPGCKVPFKYTREFL